MGAPGCLPGSTRPPDWPPGRPGLPRPLREPGKERGCTAGLPLPERRPNAGELPVEPARSPAAAPGRWPCSAGEARPGTGCSGERLHAPCPRPRDVRAAPRMRPAWRPWPKQARQILPLAPVRRPEGEQGRSEGSGGGIRCARQAHCPCQGWAVSPQAVSILTRKASAGTSRFGPGAVTALRPVAGSAAELVGQICYRYLSPASRHRSMQRSIQFLYQYQEPWTSTPYPFPCFFASSAFQKLTCSGWTRKRLKPANRTAATTSLARNLGRSTSFFTQYSLSISLAASDVGSMNSMTLSA